MGMTAGTLLRSLMAAVGTGAVLLLLALDAQADLLHLVPAFAFWVCWFLVEPATIGGLVSMAVWLVLTYHVDWFAGDYLSAALDWPVNPTRAVSFACWAAGWVLIIWARADDAGRKGRG